MDWSPVASGLTEASGRLAVDRGAARRQESVLNEGFNDGLTSLGSSANGGRKGLIVIGEGNDRSSTVKFLSGADHGKASHIQCFALLVARHRSQVGRVRRFGFNLYRLASGTHGKLYDVRTNPKLLDWAL